MVTCTLKTAFTTLELIVKLDKKKKTIKNDKSSLLSRSCISANVFAVAESSTSLMPHVQLKTKGDIINRNTQQSRRKEKNILLFSLWTLVVIIERLIQHIIDVALPLHTVQNC